VYLPKRQTIVYSLQASRVLWTNHICVWRGISGR